MKKNRTLSDTRDKISEKIGFTKDVIAQATIVTIEGVKCLYIENYKGIISYSDTQIVIQGKSNKIIVEGIRLQIEYYTNLDMKIKGIISFVKYC